MTEAVPETSPPMALLISWDLMFASRVTGTATSLGGRVEVMGAAGPGVTAAGSGRYCCVLLDLETQPLVISDLIANLPVPRPPVIAYGPHVQIDRLEEARLAGCDRVVTRGQFSSQMRELLQAGFARPMPPV